MAVSIQTIKGWGSSRKKPTQGQFWATFDSFVHKDEMIPMGKITGLEKKINECAPASGLEGHLTDTNAHQGLFDKKVDKQ